MNEMTYRKELLSFVKEQHDKTKNRHEIVEGAKYKIKRNLKPVIQGKSDEKLPISIPGTEPLGAPGATATPEEAEKKKEKDVKDMVKVGPDSVKTLYAAVSHIIENVKKRGNAGRGSRGACGGNRRRDGSGQGIGNIGTDRQPKNK